MSQKLKTGHQETIKQRKKTKCKTKKNKNHDKVKQNKKEI